jgi:glucose-6-phosphate 1-dehydrogenase
MVIFGASGDLTKRLLMPALYNLTCDGLLPEQFALVGIAMDELTTDDFRERMTRDIKSFNTRKDLDPAAWDWLCSRLYYTPGSSATRRPTPGSTTWSPGSMTSTRPAAGCCSTWPCRRRSSA